jgi:catechol 2,3-dioxygenase-like lactoylglutathione lyase family enzyme
MDRAAADSLRDLMVDLPVQRAPGIPVQHELRYEKFQASFHKWLREVALFIVHSFRQNGDVKDERKRMISGGNATVFVSNMDASVRFYTEVLGLRLTNRFGNSWATVDAGKGLTIGLHPASPKYPAPGTKGGIMLGLEIDEPIAGMVARLSEKGVRIKGSIVQDEPGNFAHLEDPDGNEIYLWETEPAPEPELVATGSAVV